MATSTKPKPKTKTSGGKMPPPNKPRTATAMVSPQNTADKIAWWCLHLLILFVAISMANLTMNNWVKEPGLFGGLPITYDQFDIIKVFMMRFFTLIALGAWGWGTLTRGGKVRVTRENWIIVAFIGWVALSTIFSIHPPTALFGKYRRFEGLLSFINYAVVLFLVLQYADRPARIRSFARTLAIAGALVSLYGVMQSLGLDPINWRSLPFEARRAFSTYGNPDLLGGFLMFPLPITIALALSEENPWWRTAYWAMFLLTGWCLFVSAVRGAWIGGTLALIVFVIVAFRARPRITKVDKGFLIVGALLLVILVIVSLSNPNEVLNVSKRVQSIFQFGQGSALTRFQIWEAAVNAIKARPVFGFGPDTFRLVFPKYKPAAYTAAAGYLSVADNVHDYPLQLTAGVGIPGLLLLYGFFIWTFAASFKTVFNGEGGGERLVYAGFWLAALGYLTHLFFGLSVTGSTIYLWLSMGILLAPFARVREVSAPSWGPVAAVALLAVCAIGIVGNFVYVRADRYYLLSRVRDSGETRVEDVKKAISLNPYNDMYRAELGLAYQDVMLDYLNQAQQLQQQGQTQQAQQAAQAAQDSFTQAEAAIKDTIAFVPSEYDNYVFLGSLYNMAGQYFGQPKYFQEAIAIAEQGEEVEPFGPAIRYQQALGYVSTQQYQKALPQLLYAIKLDPAYPDPVVLAGDVYKELGDTANAKAMYDKAMTLDLGWRKTQVEQSLASLTSSATTSAK